MKIIIYGIILLLSLTTSALSQRILPTVQSADQFQSSIYELCIDGLLFYIITTSTDTKIVQPFEPGIAPSRPPQPKQCKEENNK